MLITGKKTKEKYFNWACQDMGFDLSDVYKTWSYEKERAWIYCLDKYNKENVQLSEHNIECTDFHIVSANTFQFTVAWFYVNTETGEIEGCNIETATNNYVVVF